MYCLTNLQLIDKIVKIHNDNKVEVRIILNNKTTRKYDLLLKNILKNNILIKTNDNPDESLHDKFVIIDKKIVITGSFNWTKKGTTSNHENILFLDGQKEVSQYCDEFNEMWNKFNTIITLDEIEQKEIFGFGKKYLPKKYYRNYYRYKNYFDRYGFKKEEFIEDSDYYEDFYESDEEEEDEYDDGRYYHNKNKNYYY